MAKFSAVDAAMEGFKVIAKRPASFTVWTLLYVLLGVGPALLAMGPVMQHLADFTSQAQSMQGSGDAQGVAEKALAMELGLMSAMGPYMIWSILLQTVLFAALCRSLLEPDKRGFAYLRIGADELRVLATGIILVLLWIAFCVAVAIVTGLLAAFTERGVGHPWAGWLIALEVIAAICFSFYAVFKTSLAMPATFAEKKIRIFESWRLTRGHFWHIVGMWALSIVFVIVVVIVGGIILRVVGIGVLMGTGGLSPLSEFVTSVKSGGDVGKALPNLIHAIGPTVAVAMLLQGVLQTVTRTVVNAPYIHAYAALSGHD